MLIHQLKRLSLACTLVTNHEAQGFPTLKILPDPDAPEGTIYEGRNEAGEVEFQFDRILCDVPCSGDGTLRKNPDLWEKWEVKNANSLHKFLLKNHLDNELI